MSDSTHTAVLGPSRSGKSTLMRTLAAATRRDGHGVGVCDPNMDDWPADFATHDIAVFFRWAQQAKRCLLIIDECAETLKRDPSYVWFATRARHRGHHTVFGAHRWTMLLPAIRQSCDEVYTFRQNPSDARALCDDFADETLSAAQGLRQYHFLHKLPFLPAKLKTLRV